MIQAKFEGLVHFTMCLMQADANI